MAITNHDAADFVRSRLAGHTSRISQDEMQTLVADLKATLGRALTPGDVNEVVEVFQEILDAPARAAA